MSEGDIKLGGYTVLVAVNDVEGVVIGTIKLQSIAADGVVDEGHTAGMEVSGIFRGDGPEKVASFFEALVESVRQTARLVQ